MLEKITEHLIDKLEATNYFQKLFPFVELIDRDGKSSPEFYDKKGQYQKVSNFDHYNGLCYIRQTASDTVSKLEENSRACKILLQFVYPLRVVACVPKEKTGNDDAFTDDRVAKDLIRILTSEGGLIQQTLNASYISFIPTQVTKSKTQVIADEYSGYDIKINLKYSYIAIDLNCVVNIYDSCLEDPCETYDAPINELGFLLREDGGYVLLEDGGKIKIS